MSKFIAKTATHIVTTTPAENGGVAQGPSIRQTIMQDILAGVSKAETKVKVQALAPQSAAATKFDKHYGWYKSTMKKANLIGDTAPVQAVVVEETIEQLEARLAALKAAKQQESEADRIARLAAELAAKVDAELQ